MRYGWTTYLTMSNKMDCDTAGASTNVSKDSSGNESASSNDSLPPLELLMRPHTEEKQSRKVRRSSNVKSQQDRSALDVSSDDEPLIKLKKKSATAERPERKVNKSTRSTGLIIDASSDNEPFSKIGAKVSKTAKKRVSVPPKKKKESQDDDSLDDEPLSDLAKKLNSTRQRKAPAVSPRKATPVMKSKRNAARKRVKSAETSSDSSDNEPQREKKMSAKTKKAQSKVKVKSPKDSSSDDDDVPLVNLIVKKKPAKRNTKTAVKLQVSASKKKRGVSDESSEDEPLTELLRKKCTETKTKAPKRSDATPDARMSESSSSHSDDVAAEHPQVTKIVRIILERCDGEETRATLSPNKTDIATTERVQRK